MSCGYHTPPECQGQIVEVSYLCAGDSIVKRVHDRSDGSTTYEIAGVEDDDWSWYETYEAANGEPPIDASDWRPLAEAQADAIYAEWA